MGASSTPDSDSSHVEHHCETVEFPNGISESHSDARTKRTARRCLYSWRSKTRTLKAGIGIVHGLGEHAGRYDNLARFFVERGYDVWSYDQQGHGRDPAARGVITGYHDLLNEVGGLLELVTQQAPGLPTFLIGHSMGGNLVVNYALRRDRQPTAVIASSPMFRTPKEPKGIMNSIARVASRLAPNFRIPTGIETSWLTNSQDEQAAVEQDPLYHRRVSLRLGSDLIDSGHWAIQHASQLKVPTLITHGTLDRLTMPEGSSEFAIQAGSNCRLELLPNHQHETFRDRGGNRVLQLWVDFLNFHCRA